MADAGDLGKLSLEIRKQVYTHLLVEANTIALKCHIHPRRQAKVVRKSRLSKPSKANPYSRVRVYSRDEGRYIWMNAPIRITSILLTNKLISQEAAPVLYGSYEFFFDDAAALHEFLTCIGQSKQHLRHVELKGDGITLQPSKALRFTLDKLSWTTMDRSLDLLKAAKDLRALNFYHTGFCGRSCLVDIPDLA